MKYLQLGLFGMFAVSIFWSSWWLFLLVGVAILLIRRSYIVLCAGVLFDMSFFTLGSAYWFIGIGTVVFFTVTLLSEYIRPKLFIQTM